MASTKISNLNLWLEHTGQAFMHEHCLGVGRALKSKDIPPLLPQGVLLIRKVAAFATFKKDTTLERQGEFTLSTLQERCSRRRVLVYEPRFLPIVQPASTSKASKAIVFRLNIHSTVWMSTLSRLIQCGLILLKHNLGIRHFYSSFWHSNSKKILLPETKQESILIYFLRSRKIIQY